MTYVLVALGGGFGSLLRFVVASGLQHRYSGLFPVGTLAVNIIGSLVLGLVFVLAQKYPGQDAIRPLVMIGILGGFTTFSTFSIETLWMMQEGLWMKALLNIIISLVGCLVAVWVGMEAGRWLLARLP